MTVFIVMVCISANPDPLDAYLANLRDARVHVSFVYAKEFIPWAAISEELRQFAPGFDPIASPMLLAPGEWERDGSTEHLVLLPFDDVAGKFLLDESGLPWSKARRLEPMEMLYDDTTVAYHNFRAAGYMGELDVRRADTPLFISRFGPFAWWELPLQTLVRTEFQGARVEHRKASLAGTPVEREIRTLDVKHGWTRLEVSYNPATRYVPKYARILSYDKVNDAANIKECYVVGVRPCRAGGLIPTDWFETSFRMPNFLKSYPNYDDATVLSPPGKVGLGHFKVREFRDQTSPVQLSFITGLTGMATIGGRVPLRPSPFTLPELKALAGKKLDVPARP